MGCEGRHTTHLANPAAAPPPSPHRLPHRFRSGLPASTSGLPRLARSLQVQHPPHRRPLLDGARHEEAGRALDLVLHRHLGPPAKDAKRAAAQAAQADGVRPLDDAKKGLRREGELLCVRNTVFFFSVFFSPAGRGMWVEHVVGQCFHRRALAPPPPLASPPPPSATAQETTPPQYEQIPCRWPWSPGCEQAKAGGLAASARWSQSGRPSPPSRLFVCLSGGAQRWSATRSSRAHWPACRRPGCSDVGARAGRREGVLSVRERAQCMGRFFFGSSKRPRHHPRLTSPVGASISAWAMDTVLGMVTALTDGVG